MELTVQIPDDLARSMGASSGDLSRRALEADFRRFRAS
jgi:hypothetical protein